MHILLWSVIGLAVLVSAVFLGIRFYLYLFLRKMERVNEEILRLLQGGLLQSFRENAPYEDVKEAYCRLIELLKVFSEYVHFMSLRGEKTFDRRSDCLIVEYRREEGRSFARMHFRAFPIRTLLEKIRPRENFIEAFQIVERLFQERADLEYVELITHNKLISESIVRKIIERNGFSLNYTMEKDYGVDYFPWIYAEWLMIQGGEHPESAESYAVLRKINRPVYIRLERRA